MKWTDRKKAIVDHETPYRVIQIQGHTITVYRRRGRKYVAFIYGDGVRYFTSHYGSEILGLCWKSLGVRPKRRIEDHYVGGNFYEIPRRGLC